MHKYRKAYQLEKDQNSLNSKMTIFNSNSNHQTVNNNRSYTNMIESVKFYENAIQQIQTQINQAEDMVSNHSNHFVILWKLTGFQRWMN